MAQKKAKATKKPIKKTPVKKTVKKKVTKGDSYICGVCGLTVTVERIGNIVYTEESPIICCGKLMKKNAKQISQAE
jgi:hypothetical protein